MTVTSLVSRAHALMRRAFFLMLFSCLGTVGVAAVAVQAQAADSGVQTPAPAVPGGVVNINSATEKELAYLPGIGPSKASKIVAYRMKRPFKRISHLARVRGIGLKTVRRLKSYLALKGETTLRKAVKLPPKKKRK